MKMLDQSTDLSPAAIADLNGQEFDLVVIGAGIAGLNALFAATEYFPSGARVLLLDQKTAPGGMWNTAYDYVRLHQPHPMFTVGDLDWDWKKPRDYLAARDEVQSHLGGSLTAIREQVSLQTGFQQTVSSCKEVETDQGPVAEIIFHPNGTDATQQSVRAKKAVHASGLNYQLATPLDLTSENVVSIIPQDLRATLHQHQDAPVVVVGGGKTGMDTVLAALAANPARNMSLIQGRGTNFFNRTKFVPTGLKRWTTGELISRVFRDVALMNNGDNEEEALANFRKKYATDPTANNGVFLYGLQSEEELSKIKSGVAHTYSDYLKDVIETPTGPQMIMRSGEAVEVEKGTIFVNCTGSFFRATTLPEGEPILSKNSCILRINARNSFHFLTSVAAFFLTHSWFRNQLRGHGYYVLDHEDLFRKNRNAWVSASAAQAYMNQVIAVQNLPLKLLDRCGLDLDKWYPLPRRMAGLIRMKSTAARDIAHCRQVLNRIAERFDVHAAPLD